MREAADRVAARLEELIKPQKILGQGKPESTHFFKQSFTHFGFEALQVEG